MKCCIDIFCNLCINEDIYGMLFCQFAQLNKDTIEYFNFTILRDIVIKTRSILKSKDIHTIFLEKGQNLGKNVQNLKIF